MPPGQISRLGNHVFGQTAIGDAGIFVSSSVSVTGNDVYGNYDGIATYDLTSIVSGNRIFSNANNGITASFTAERSSATASTRTDGHQVGSLRRLGHIEENLIYANTTPDWTCPTASAASYQQYHLAIRRNRGKAVGFRL